MSTIIPASVPMFLGRVLDDGRNRTEICPVLAWQVASNDMSETILLPMVSLAPFDPPRAIWLGIGTTWALGTTPVEADREARLTHRLVNSLSEL